VFLPSYFTELIGSWPVRLLLGVPTVVAVAGAVIVSHYIWLWIALILLSVVLAQLYVAYRRWTPFRPAIVALGEELEYNRRRIREWSEHRPLPAFSDTEWRKRKDFLREYLDSETYRRCWDCFDSLDKFNRDRGSIAVGEGGFDNLLSELDAVDHALRDKL
jgi:hypothetical protein